MTETWLIRTYDGEEYNLHTGPADPRRGVDHNKIYNLQNGAYGHHGMPVTIVSDKIPNIAGAETREIQRDVRVVYLPIRITGKTPADLSKNVSKFRRSISPENEAQLWVTNDENVTKVLYCRYQKGFETVADSGTDRGVDWQVFPVYFEADDPYWYDPPGAEITRNFSSIPWSTNFLNYSVMSGFTKDALKGDTRVTVEDTSNFAAGKPIQIRGSKVVVGSELDIGIEGEEQQEDPTMEPIPTNIYLTVDNETPQINQPIHIHGKLIDMFDGHGLADKIIKIIKEFIPNEYSSGSSGSSTCTQTLVQTGGGTNTATQICTSVKITVTDSNGVYKFTDIPDKEGTYNYTAQFLGDIDELFCHHTPSEHTKTIKAGTTSSTTLTLLSSVGNPAINESFRLYGTLQVGTTPVPNKLITLYKATSRGNTEIGKTNTNNAGQYTFTRSESVAAWNSYEVVYEGDAIHEDTRRRLSGWLEWLFDLLFGWIEGRHSEGSYAPAHAKIDLKIGIPTYPINYHVGLTPNQINDGEIQYFGAHGFNSVTLIAEKIDDVYSSEKTIITGQGLMPIIDISVVTNNALNLVDNPIHQWLHDLYTAGWRYVAGINSKGRTGDPAYLNSHFGFKYINYNSAPRGTTGLQPDISGTGVYLNSFQCMTPAAIPFIEQFTTAAYGATPHVKSGLFAPVIANSALQSNKMLDNSVGSAPPTYRSILDWSYKTLGSSGGMSNFLVWFHPKYNALTHADIVPEQLTLYKSLGFESVIDSLQDIYIPLGIEDGTTYTWTEPTVKAVNLTMEYITSPLTFSGVLTKIMDGSPIKDATINLQIHPYSLLKPITKTCTAMTKTSNGNPASGQKVITFSDTTGFIPNANVTISDTNHLETGIIASVQTNVSITLFDNLTYSYTTPSVTQASNIPANQKVITFSNTTDFIVNAGVTISDSSHTETGIIASIQTNVSITLQSNLSYSYSTPTVSENVWPLGQKVIYVGQPTDFAASDYVTVKDDLHSESRQISSISGDKITLTANMTYGYDTNKNAQLYNRSTSDWKTIATDITDEDGTYSINIGVVTKISSGSPLSGQKDILFTDTNGFIVGSNVKISDLQNEEMGVIASITANTKITLVTNLEYSYTLPTVTARNPAGEHWYRINFAGGTVGGVSYTAFNSPSNSGIQILHLIYYDTIPVSETNSVASVDSPTVLTLSTALSNDYLVNNESYITTYDTIDTFLNPDDVYTRYINNNVEFVIFWLRGCPPCYGLKNQMAAIQSQFGNITLTFCEIQDHESGVIDEMENVNIGMDEAAIRYPMGYNFAQSCGPPLPASYGVIGTVMPAVLCLYRDGLFIKGWCGVHTTGTDPVSSDVIMDTAGPRLTWRLGESYIGSQSIILNQGDNVAYPVWTIIGPGLSPTLRNVTTGESLSLNYNLSAGEAVVIDTREFAHTCASTKRSSYSETGYMKSDMCPTCQGKGVIPASCENCGGSQICPTCNGSGTVSVWVPGSLGTTSSIGDMYNLRYAINQDERDFWGFDPGANVLEIEMGIAEYGKSIVNLSLIQRYEGI